MRTITELLQSGVVVLGDGGYLIELERRGFVDSGSRREPVGTGRGTGQFTPEVAIEDPGALRELHREFLQAGSQVLQALTFFGAREKLNRAGYGAETERINHAAVRLAREVAGDRALVAGSVSRTQLIEREGMGSLDRARDDIAEQIRLLDAAGVDFLILETFFHLAEMKVALECAATAGLAAIATMSFRPLRSQCSDGHTPAECAKVMAGLGAIAVGANCEQDPRRMLPLLREMRAAVDVALAAQPAAFRTTDTCHSFTRLPAFPNELETIQVSRREFVGFGEAARKEGVFYVGGCCGCNAAYIRALAAGLAEKPGK
ncbi:MAG TPA: homocysteine S-methyltransferase family protein [Verrucomicrobiales bacterium]|nr:homocysteine S-methyltransferase family protein [Verrucomicrobiales bacterium]